MYTAEQFLQTWHLYQGLISPSDAGFTVDRLKKAQVVGHSLMAQFELLAAERDPAFLKKCTVAYGKILLEPSGAYVCVCAHIHTRTHTHARVCVVISK